MIQPGTYHARATVAEYGTTKNGTEQIGVNFVITSSPNGQYDGASLVWYGYFTEKTSERTVEALNACGCEVLSTLEGITNNEVQIVVSHEPHFETGEPTPRIQWINKLGGIAMKRRMSEHEVKVFAAKWQGKLDAVRKKLGTTSSPNASKPNPRPPQVPPPGASHDDDIPF